MSERELSTADRFCIALAAVRDLDTLVSTDHPLRHAVWKLKNTAGMVLYEATREAFEVVEAAKSMVRDFDAHEQEKQS